MLRNYGCNNEWLHHSTTMKETFPAIESLYHAVILSLNSKHLCRRILSTYCLRFLPPRKSRPVAWRRSRPSPSVIRHSCGSSCAYVRVSWCARLLYRYWDAALGSSAICVGYFRGALHLASRAGAPAAGWRYLTFPHRYWKRRECLETSIKRVTMLHVYICTLCSIIGYP